MADDIRGLQSDKREHGITVLAESLDEAGFGRRGESREQKPMDSLPVAVRLRPDDEIGHWAPFLAVTSR